jgi:anti-anti-sigma regulatory factor
MTGGLGLEVSAAHPVAVIRPTGVLDALSAPDLRSALLECLVEQPVAVVLDIADLVVGDDVALTVLATVARESVRWPGTRIALGGAVPETVAAIERMGVGQYLTLFSDQATALGECGRWPVPPCARHEMEPDRFAPAIARDAVDSFCLSNTLDPLDPAQLVTSELVTNAVLHAGTQITLTLRLIGPFLHIAVRDRGGGVVRIASVVDEFTENGRGLLLVDALAAAWGNLVTATGKVVWATIRTRPTPSEKRPF